MKKMWIQLKEDDDLTGLKRNLSEIGQVETDVNDPRRVVLTFHNQSENGIRMAGYELTENFIHKFEDFDMIW